MYPSFIKLQQASADLVPVARIAMAAIILLGQSTDYEHLLPDEVYKLVLEKARS